MDSEHLEPSNFMLFTRINVPLQASLACSGHVVFELLVHAVIGVSSVWFCHIHVEIYHRPPEWGSVERWCSPQVPTYDSVTALLVDARWSKTRCSYWTNQSEDYRIMIVDRHVNQLTRAATISWLIKFWSREIQMLAETSCDHDELQAQSCKLMHPSLPLNILYWTTRL